MQNTRPGPTSWLKIQQLLPRLRRHLYALGNNALLGYLSLFVLQMKVLWGVWNTWDLPLWDGATYFIYARQVAHSFSLPPFEWSPLFAGYYAIFHVLFADVGPFVIYFAHRLTTIILVLMLLYTLLRATLSPAVAWLLTVYFILLPIGVTNHYVVHLFVLIPLLGTYRMSLSGSAYGNGFILVGLLSVAFVRSEFVLAFIIALVGLMLNDHILSKNKGSPIRQRLGPYTPLLIAGLALVPMIIRLGPSHIPVNRLWGAFMQHYAWGYQERYPGWNVDFWFRYREAIEQSFGGANSLSQAALHNPIALVSHFLWNLGLLPGAIVNVLTPFVTLSWTGALIGLGLVGLLVAAVTNRWSLWQRRSEIFRLGIVGRHKLWFLVLCSLLSLLVSVLIIRPRPIYLMPLLPFVFLITGLGLEVLLRKYAVARRPEWMLPPVFVILLIAFPTPFSAPIDRPVIRVVEALRKIPVEGTYSLLGPSARGFCAYSMPDRCQGVEIVQVPTDEPLFEQFLREHDIRVIIVNSQLASNLPPAGQAFIAKLEGRSDEIDWRAFERIGSFNIYIRDDM